MCSAFLVRLLRALVENLDFSELFRKALVLLLYGAGLVTLVTKKMTKKLVLAVYPELYDMSGRNKYTVEIEKPICGSRFAGY